MLLYSTCTGVRGFVRDDPCDPGEFTCSDLETDVVPWGDAKVVICVAAFSRGLLALLPECRNRRRMQEIEL